MKPETAPSSGILWHPRSAALPDSGPTHSGLAHTPFGTMRIVWTDDFLLEAGFEETSANDIPSPTAQELADLIVTYAPLPIRPLAIGTPFQLRVWQALTRIPYGTTSSYRDIAHTIHSPNATRAVGTAIGANHLALVIPCHRIIRHSGHIGGFGWGIPTKQKLLAHEQLPKPNILLSRPGH